VFQFLMEYSTNSIPGTAYNDWFESGGFGPGQVIRAGAGNDDISNEWEGDSSVFGQQSGATVEARDGDDHVSMIGANNTVYDGPGQDTIDIQYGVTKAAIDGGDDYHLNAGYGRLSYGDATQGLTADGFHTWSDQIGYDDAFALELVGGSGDDTLWGYQRIQGGAGSDHLTPVAFAEGGAGDDILIAQSDQRVALRGQAGDDTFIFFSQAKCAGDAGADRSVVKNAVEVTINDLTQGDWVDLSALLAVSIDQAFGQGYLSSKARAVILTCPMIATAAATTLPP
jgi:hypothetical protein